ncbi:restriction endonuclease subunit S [Burkholderia sp. BCC1970]|uniref:restriction endonuclease subunit S n=1 Tax=Burkholderia sp. BCC1970 TaxID=2817437 RepID=UPI002ABDD2DC|nr:restriction endonuclease subunit S [Burkholderia sp. BCC1970]
MNANKSAPDGWKSLSIRELVNEGSKRNPTREDGGSFQYVDIEALDNRVQKITAPKRINCSNAPSRARVEMKEGDVLFSLVRPYLKNVAVVPAYLDGEVASTAFCCLRPKDWVEPRFLFYQLIRERFINSIPTYGNSPPAARDDEFLGLVLNVPPTRDEQKAIADTLDELLSDLDAGVAALTRAEANLKRYRSSLLKAAMEGRLTADRRAKNQSTETGEQLRERILKARRERWEENQLASYSAQSKQPPKNWRDLYVEPEEPDIKSLPDLPKLPEGWCWTTLSQLGTVERGKSKHRPRNDPALFGGAYPFIQTGEVRRAKILISEYSETYSEFGLSQSRLWPVGTLCITIAANIAETAILGFRACFPDSVVGFLPALDELPVRYIEAYIRTVRKRLEALAPATAQKNINLDTLKGLLIPLPPLDEIDAIMDLLSSAETVIDQTEEHVAKQLTRGERLRQALLNSAVDGALVRAQVEVRLAAVA